MKAVGLLLLAIIPSFTVVINSSSLPPDFLFKWRRRLRGKRDSEGFENRPLECSNGVIAEARVAGVRGALLVDKSEGET